MTGARWTNGIMALWLALSALLGFTIAGNVVNAVTVGTIVAGAGIALMEDSRWQGWVATLAGLWLVVAMLLPFLRSGTGLLWDSMAISVAILLASVRLGGGTRDGHPGQHGRRSASRPESAPAPSRGRWERDVPAGSGELVHH